MSDKEAAPAEAPPKSKKMLIIIIAAVVVLLGGGAASYFLFFKSSSSAKTYTKGVVTSIDSAITINLSDSHYLKLGFALQQTAEGGSTAVDTAEALNLAIDEYTGVTEDALSTEAGRDKYKAELLAKIIKAYTVDGTEQVMGIYYTSFVTQ